MQRRTFLQAGLAVATGRQLQAAIERQDFGQAVEVLDEATRSKQVHAAALHVVHKGKTFQHSFGQSQSPDDMFLIASISKPMSVAALMTLFDSKKFQLDDPAIRFLPNLKGHQRDLITIRHLLTHVSGLPDQLPENQSLRKQHVPLSGFVERALRTPLLFTPGTKYSYSSMGILLATEIASRITKTPFRNLIAQNVFQPLKMKHSVLGLAPFKAAQTLRCQTQQAAPESGAGEAGTQNWDWNSPYWRNFGAPWGGIHASAGDVARFLDEFLHLRGRIMRPATLKLMRENHNPPPLRPRGLGFVVGAQAGSPGCSEQSFGHSGSTGTLAWADPQSDTICVVLTTLPGRAVTPHPRTLASQHVATAVR